MFSHPYSYFMASERLQELEKLHFKNYRFRIPRFHAKMLLKSAPQKLQSLMAKAMSKNWTLDSSCKCPGTFPHSYTQ